MTPVPSRSPSCVEADAPPSSSHCRGGASRTSAEKLTPKEFSLMLIMQGGVCRACKGPGPFEADHSTPNAIERGKPDQLLCEPCHDLKTFGPAHMNIGDVSKVAKMKRHRDGRTQHDRRLEKGSRLRSRGFDKTKSKRMNGEVVNRG